MQQAELDIQNQCFHLIEYEFTSVTWYNNSCSLKIEMQAIANPLYFCYVHSTDTDGFTFIGFILENIINR